jgi:L-seryl-tRNA(Ser) seleniumtransferase
MGNPQVAGLAGVLRMLPSTDEVLTSPDVKPLVDKVGRRRLADYARVAIDDIRNELAKSGAAGTSITKADLLGDALTRLTRSVNDFRNSRLGEVINATGVVIHTNLGRAPLSKRAIESIQNAAGYCALEYDLGTGKRGRRGAYVEELVSEITGAEAALVVNNCAAAAFIVLSVFARGGEVIVSRGEIVEIGGDFRIPDVLAQSGATLREVGTTNRTKISDYEKAMGDSTTLVMRVHPSNYKIIGFTETPSLKDLALLAHRNQKLLYEDAGSGALVDLSRYGLADEPLIARSIEHGADIVTFSGDKLLGGSQAGFIVGRRSLIEQIRKHPLYRALRVDKMIYAALQATLEAYAFDRSETEIPVIRMLSISKEEIGKRVDEVVSKLDATKRELQVEVVEGESVIGGGSSPDTRLATFLIALRHPKMSSAEIEIKLRSLQTPLITRIEGDRVLIDLRTVAVEQEEKLIEALLAIA